MADPAEVSAVSEGQRGKRKRSSQTFFGSLEEFGEANLGSSGNKDQGTAFSFGTSPTSTKTSELSSRASIPKPTPPRVAEGQSSLFGASTTASIFTPKTSQSRRKSNPATGLTLGTTRASAFTSFSTHSQGSMSSPAQISGPLNQFSTPPKQEINFGNFAPPVFRGQVTEGNGIKTRPNSLMQPSNNPSITYFQSSADFFKSYIGSNVNGDQETALPFPASSTSMRGVELSSPSSIPKPTSCCVTEGKSILLGSSATAPVSTAKTSQPLDPAVSTSRSTSVMVDYRPRKRRRSSNPATEPTLCTTSGAGQANEDNGRQTRPNIPVQPSNGPSTGNTFMYPPFPVMDFTRGTPQMQPNAYICLPIIPGFPALIGGLGQLPPFSYGNPGCASPNNNPMEASGDTGGN